MTNTLANLARMSTATTGTGTITLGSAVEGFLAFADELSSGDVITYAIEDGNNREIGQGTFTISGATHTLTRSTVYASTQGGSQISLSGSAQVFVTAAAEDILGNFVDVRRFGAIGDGVADDSDAIQAAIASANTGGKRLYFPSGTYKITEQLLIHDGATWFGDGPDLSVITVGSAAGNIIPFRTNTTSGTKNVFDQSNIMLSGIHFQGYDDVLTVTASETHSPLIRMWKVDGLKVQNCKFSGHRYIMLSLGGVKNFSITNCEFADWGRTDDLAASGTLPANEGGAAIWCGANPTDSTPTTFGVIDGNYFHDSEWSSIYMLGQDLQFINNRVENIKEGEYATTKESADNDSQNIVFANNVYKGVTKRLVQATGFECGSKGSVIANNIFQDVAGPGIDLTDTCEATTVVGNYLLDCNTSSDFANYASITVRATNVTADAIDGVTICNNVVRSSGGYYGVRLYRVSGSDTFNNVRVVNNDLVGAASSSSNNLAYDSSQFGTNVTLKDNHGASDYVAAAETWTPTISASSGTITTASALAAHYWRVGGVVHFSIVISVSDNGTGAGTLRFTLPSTPARAGAGSGVNTSNARALSVQWGTTTTVNVNEYQANYPVSSGQLLRISGTYLEA